jgi:HSP20 family protein
MTQLNNALVRKNDVEPGPGAFFRAPLSIPAADVSETGDSYMLSMDMPGAQKEAITVSVVEGILVVRAPIVPVHGEEATVLYREIRTGTYERRFALGEGIDRNNVDARYENGVLTVRLLKSESSKPKEIVIR